MWVSVGCGRQTQAQPDKRLYSPAAMYSARGWQPFSHERGSSALVPACGRRHPDRNQKAKCAFSFDDLVLLRKAEGLVEQRIPARRVRDAIKKIRDGLPPGASVQRVALSGEGQRVIADDGHRRCTGSGQFVFDFKGSSPDEGGATVTSLANARASANPWWPRVAAHRARPLQTRLLAGNHVTRRSCDAYRAALELEPSLRTPCEPGACCTRWATLRGLVTIGRIRSGADRGARLSRAFNVGVALDLGATVERHHAYRRALECERATPTRTTTWRAFWSKMASQTWPCATCCLYVS